MPGLGGTAAAADRDTTITAGATYEQFIVTFAGSASRQVTSRAVTQLRELSTGGVVVRAPRGLRKVDALRLMADLGRQPGVVGVEPDLKFMPLFTPNDRRYGEQWDLFEATAGMNVEGAWDTVDGTGVTVAVLDTGITPHSDLTANVLPGYDFINDAATARDGDRRDANPNDEGDWFLAGECGSPSPSNSSWHGTHVAGTIGALANNTNGIAGIAHKAKIVPARCSASAAASPPTSPTRSPGRPAAGCPGCRPTPTRPR